MWDFVALWQTRTDGQCQHRWQKVLNPELVKGPWTKEEDQRVRRVGCYVSSEEDRDGWINGKRWWIWVGCDDLIVLSFRVQKSLSSSSTKNWKLLLQYPTTHCLEVAWQHSRRNDTVLNTQKSHFLPYSAYNVNISLEVVHLWVSKTFVMFLKEVSYAHQSSI